MNKGLLKIGILTNFLFIFFASKIFALDLDKYSGNIAGQAGYRTDVANPGFLDSLLGKIIGFALGFVGLIFLILIIVSGFQWMTSGGNEEKVKKARQQMINAVIGLALVIGAYVITYFVYTIIQASSKGGPITP